MSKTTQGVLALVVFGLLLLFFIAAWATATKSVAQNGSSTPSGVILAPTVGGVLSPLAAPNPAAAVGSTPLAGQPIRYTVQAGEWLRAIALRYGTTVDAILAINPQITNPDQLTPGQEILIPSAGN